MSHDHLRLGQALISYTGQSHKSYDPEFDAAVRERFPHWFNKVANKKAEILALPVESPRPHQKKHPLGGALTRYITTSSNIYDAEFTSQVHARFPHWFSDLTRKKRELLALPLDHPRPHSRKHLLGQALVDATSRKKASYDPAFDAAIRSRFPGWFVDTAANKKAEILALPESEPRPHQTKHPLGTALAKYTGPSSGSYDPDFHDQLRGKFPHWFVDTVAINHQAIMSLPLGSPRPPQRTKLGRALCNYTNTSSNTYDAEFRKLVEERFPKWFISTADQAKTELLNLPPGSPRPSCKEKNATPLGQGLVSYTNNNDGSYDPVFDQAIRARFPEWFVDRSAVNKADLLALPDGSLRPPSDTKLGSALGTYMNKSHTSYDPAFTDAIRARFPEWFEDHVARKKQELLSLPVGSPRPTAGKHPLSAALNSYTSQSHKSYDAEFKRQIDARFPRWFEDTAARNKAELLALPLGSPRPSKQTLLGRVLGNYRNKNVTWYDPEFDAAIRARFPHWFKGLK
jgi:hypothetical protein